MLLLAIVGAALLLSGSSDEATTAPPVSATEAIETPAPVATVSLPATPDYHSLLVSGGRILFGSHTGIQISSDGGRTWNRADFEGDAMNLAEEQDGTIWAAGHEVLSRSSDAGKTWSSVTPAGLSSLDLHGFTIDPKSDALYAAVAGQGLYRSDDGGESFAVVSSKVGAGVMALLLTPDDRILAGDMQMGLLASDDKGKSWQQVLKQGLMGLARNPSDPKRLLASGPEIYLSPDSGASWRPVTAVGGNGFGPITWATDQMAYAISLDGAFYKTTDGGLTWKDLS